MPERHRVWKRILWEACRSTRDLEISAGTVAGSFGMAGSAAGSAAGIAACSTAHPLSLQVKLFRMEIAMPRGQHVPPEAG